MAMPISHCQYCGSPFGAAQPVKNQLLCAACKRITYRNPLPVAVIIVPTVGGIWLVRRGVDPGRGRLALVSGFVEKGEDWREAGAREVFEEINLIIPDPKRLIRVLEVESTPSGNEVLIFGIVEKWGTVEIGPFKPSEEALERSVFRFNEQSEDFAFPLHEKMIRRYLKM